MSRHPHLTTLFLGLALLAGCRGPSNPPPEEAISGVDLHYGGRVEFDVDAGALDADLSARLVDESATTLAFLLHGALELAAVEGEYVTGHHVEPAPNIDTWNRIAVELGEGAAGSEIRFRYRGVIPTPESRINQISPDWVELSVDTAWHPIVESFDRTLTYDLELGLPAGWTVVSPGTAVAIEDGYRMQTGIDMIDIPFAAAPNLEEASGKRETVFHRGASTETTDAILDAAAYCRAYLDERFGSDRPLPDVAFALPDRPESGYARKTFIALTSVDPDDRVGLTRFLCHELSHYWSTGAAPFTVDNWLNEGFAVFVAAQACRRRYGDESWDKTLADWERRSEGQGTIWTPNDLSRRPYEINYKKGPLALSRLEQRIGMETMDRIVTRYMTDPVDDTPTLLELIEAESDAESRAWFVSVLAESESASAD
ncbi:hypothetical protein ABI59_20665 [Acidobacteria bacterium Mor1]|nr:hypothetical protein ABI59_20665 [Acidobacteria bacterium Mor1]